VALSALSLTARTTSSVGRAVTFTGTLSFGSGTAVPAGTVLSLSRTRTTPAGAKVALTGVKTKAGGAYTFSDVPPTTGVYAYTVSYKGTATQSSASATFDLAVGLSTTLRLAASAGTVSYQQKVTLTATLGKTDNGHTVQFYAQTAGSATRRLIGTKTANSKGAATMTYWPSSSTYFSATFPGDKLYAPVTATLGEVSVRASVTEVLSGYYKSETYKGIVWRVYHHTTSLDIAIAVAPNKAGEAIQVYIEVDLNGTWIKDLVVTNYLNSPSTIDGIFGLETATGGNFRVQTIYYPSYPSGARDITNLGSNSSWQYFAVRS
jgi:hypothetical protein